MKSIPAAFMVSAQWLLAACSVGNQTTASGRQIIVSFHNQSQFTVESLFVHDKPLNYPSVLDALLGPLETGESILAPLPCCYWYVTVFRKPNKDSEVLAYTTATAWDVLHYPKLIYFDEMFRVATE